MTDFLIRAGVQETTNSTGPGTLDLEGAATGWNRFRTRDVADNDYVVYVRRSANGAKHQLVRGQIKFGTGAGGKDQLTVATVLVSTDGGASPTAIDWVAGDNPCAVFMASAEDLLDSALRNHFGAARPAWFKKGLWVAEGAGATARKAYWFDGTNDIELATFDETNNTTVWSGLGLTLTSTDATAAAGPTITLYRDSATPAASDVIGEIAFSGEDSGGGTDIYARAYGVITDPTAASEDGELRIDTSVAGTKANRLRVGAGLYTAGATGGDKGVDTINTNALYIGGALSGGMVKLTSISLSGASQADVTFDSSVYRAIVFYFDAVVMTSDGASLLARVSTDSGSTFLSTGTYNHLRVAGDTTPAVAAAGSTTDTSILMAASVDSTASQNLSGEGKLIIGGAAANATKLEWDIGYIESTAARPTKVNGYGSNSTTSQVNAVRFLPSTSTFASGNIHPYGILK